MLPTEILTFAISSLLSAWLRMRSRKNELEHQKFNSLLNRPVETRATELSVQKTPAVGGLWVRRLMVSTVLFTVFLAPFFVATLWPDVPVYYAYTEMRGRWLGGIFGPPIESLRYVEIRGFVILPVHTQMASAICGYYFGVSAVK